MPEMSGDLEINVSNVTSNPKDQADLCNNPWIE
jgi:hypothetical protein